MVEERLSGYNFGKKLQLVVVLIVLASMVMTAVPLMGLSDSMALDITIGIGSGDSVSDQEVAIESSSGDFFTENKGQWDEEILFLSETSFGHIGIGKDCVYYDIRERTANEPIKRARPGIEMIGPNIPDLPEPQKGIPSHGYILKYTFEGSNDAVVRGIDPLSHYSNYFLGSDRSRWQSHVLSYPSVLYEDIYDGIDLRFRFDGGDPKYDFILSPYADPDQVRIRPEGQNSIQMDGTSISFIAGGKTILSERDLLSFYGSGPSADIGSTFRSFTDGTIGFELGQYDRSREVVIDPFIYSTLIGGTLDDEASVEVTSSGDIIVPGYTYSTDFPTTPGAYDRIIGGNMDSSVTKLASDGSGIIWSTYIGGSGSDWLYYAFIAPDGSIYMAGDTPSTDFPTTAGAFCETYNGGNHDAAIVKLRSDGTDLIFSTFVGAPGNYDELFMNCMMTDDGEIVCSGNTDAAVFPTTTGAYDTTFNGDRDMFIYKLEADGSDMVFSTFIGGEWTENCFDMITNLDGDIILLGYTDSTEYPTTSGAYQTALNGGSSDMFITVLKEDGSDLLASTYLGGTLYDYPRDVLVDDQGDILFHGYTDSSDYPTTVGAFSRTFKGSNDVFVTKMKEDLTQMIWSTFIGGSGWEGAEMGSFFIGSENDLIIQGKTDSTDFPTPVGAFDRTKDQPVDARFIFRLSDDGSSMLASTLFESGTYDSSIYLGLDSFGDIYLTGHTNNTNYPTTLGADDEGPISEELNDLVLTKFEYDLSDLDYSSYYGGSGIDEGMCVFSEFGDIFFSGKTNSVDFPTTDGSVKTGEYDAFVAQIIGGVAQEPIEVYSVKTYQDEGYMVPGNVFDIGDRVYVELLGKNPNATLIDKATVNISFRDSSVPLVRLRLSETAVDSNVYRGFYTVTQRALYFDSAKVYAKKDPTKFTYITIDYPYRPTQISGLGAFKDIQCTQASSKADFSETVFIQERGQDSNPIKIDKAFVNLSSDKNSSYRPLLVLTETGTNTGTYRGSMEILTTMEYFENITLTSGEDPSKTAMFMVHTPVQVRARSDYLIAKEDEDYNVEFFNFGYNSATWTVTTDAQWLTWDETAGELHGTPRNNDVGNDLWNVLLKLEDSYGNAHDMEFKLTVLNSFPNIITEPITVCNEKEEYVLDINSDDDDQGDINWYLNSESPFLTIDKSTGVLRGTPIEGDEGTYLVNVQVQDGNDGSDNLMFNLTVLGQNDRPRITTTDIKQIEQDTPFRRDYDVFDPDEGDTHNWTLSTDAEWLSMENETGVLFGTPDGYDIGDWLVNITVTDEGGLGDSREFTLRVVDKKDRPRWVDVPSDIELLHGTEYYFDSNATDPDSGTTLVYTIDTKTECDMRINPMTGEIGWTAKYRSMPRSGGIQVTLMVSDGELFSLHDYTITVIPTESPTAVISLPAKGGRTLSNMTRLEWTGSDPENEPLTYTIYLADDESYVSAKREEDIWAEGIDGTDYDLTGLVQGKTYYWTVIPDDGCTSGSCTNGIYSFRVNFKPVLKEVDGRNAEAGKEFTYKLEGSDNDLDDKLTYSVLSGPKGLTVRSESGMLVWTPGDDQTGVHKVRVKVTDGHESVERSFDIEVAEGSGIGMGLVIGLVVGALVLIIVLVLIYVFVIKGRGDDKKEEEDEDTKKMREDMEQKQHEREWEEAHTRDSDHTVVSEVPISAVDAHAHDHDGKQKSYDELYGDDLPEE